MIDALLERCSSQRVTRITRVSVERWDASSREMGKEEGRGGRKEEEEEEDDSGNGGGVMSRYN